MLVVAETEVSHTVKNISDIFSSCVVFLLAKKNPPWDMTGLLRLATVAME